MSKIDYDKLILTTELANQDENCIINPNFTTKDKVFLYSKDEIKDLTNEERLPYVTDYAVMCGALLLGGRDTGYKDKKTAWKLCRSFFKEAYDEINMVLSDGEIGEYYSNHTMATIFPVIHLDLNYFIEMKENFIFETNKKGNYHTVDIGLKFPKTYVGDNLCHKLTKLKNSKNLEKTGAKYTGYRNAISSCEENEEYQFNGERYVCLKVNNGDYPSEFEDHTSCPKSGEVCWAKVEPIIWRIRNWNDLPTTINPEGNGTAKCVELESEEGIISGIPFYPKIDGIAPYKVSMWQNSLIRAWLNGYDLKQEIDCGNGKKAHKADINFNFKGKGFLYEAMQGANLERSETVLPNDYDFNFKELNNDDLLNTYVDANVPVFLHGPSGVGKSARVKELDKNATRISLRPQMNPEEIDGTLDRETGKYIPPLWYTQLCEKCEKEPNKKHILFIDELTNVKPTIQSLVYGIVLDRAGKDGLWPLPNNAVVVAAGNESAGNLAAYPLTNALYRRFSHIYFHVDKEDWLDWATGIEKIHKNPLVDDKTPHDKIHPAIIDFISKYEGALNQDLDEENPEIVTDPRKWEIASKILYATKNPYALRPAIGDLTDVFVEFVNPNKEIAEEQEK